MYMNKVNLSIKGEYVDTIRYANGEVEVIKGENCPLGIVCRNSNRDDDGQWTWMTDVDVLYCITYEGVAQS